MRKFLEISFFLFMAVTLCIFSLTTASEPKFVLPHRGCYVSSDTLHDLESDQFKLSDVNPMLCTYVVYAFAAVQAGELHLTPTDEENIRICNMMKTVNPTLNVLLAIDTGNAQTDREISNSLSSTQTRTRFVDSVVQKLRNWNVDGLALHTERLSYTTAFTVSQLLKELSERFYQEGSSTKQARLALVVNVGNAAKSSPLDSRLLANVSDIVQVRAFDYHTPNFEPSMTGHNAPLYRAAGAMQATSQLSGNIETTFQEWEMFGIPKHKLVLSIALYGQAWKLVSKHRYEAGAPAAGVATMLGNYLNEPGRLAYHDICERLISDNLTRVFDSDAMGPFAHDNETKTWVSYDDLDSVRIKARWILEKNYSGVVFWELSLEDFNGTCGQLPLTLLKGVADIFSANAKVIFDEKRECDRSFCLKRGTGVFALGGCQESYCNCDYGGKAYKFPCGPGTVFDPLILACNYAQNIKGCQGMDVKH